MRIPPPATRLRYILPLAELLACLLILGPALPMTLHMTVYSIHLHAADLPEDREEFFPTENTTSVISVRPQADSFLPNPLVAVSMLNLPALAVEVPVSLLAANSGDEPYKEWIPRGYFNFLWIWRAASWPLIGLYFWYLVGRAIDACLAYLRGKSLPHYRRRDLAYAIPLVLFSLGYAVYAHSANDFEYLETSPFWLTSAGILWAALFSLPILAFYLQHRAAGRTSSGPLEAGSAS